MCPSQRQCGWRFTLMALLLFTLFSVVLFVSSVYIFCSVRTELIRCLVYVSLCLVRLSSVVQTFVHIYYSRCNDFVRWQKFYLFWFCVETVFRGSRAQYVVVLFIVRPATGPILLRFCCCVVVCVCVGDCVRLTLCSLVGRPVARFVGRSGRQ